MDGSPLLFKQKQNNMIDEYILEDLIDSLDLPEINQEELKQIEALCSQELK